MEIKEKGISLSQKTFQRSSIKGLQERDVLKFTISLSVIFAMYLVESLITFERSTYSDVWISITVLFLTVIGLCILPLMYKSRIDFFSPINIFLIIVALMFILYPSLILTNEYKYIRVFQNAGLDLQSNLVYLQKAIFYATIGTLSFAIGYHNPVNSHIASRMPCMAFKPVKGEKNIYYALFGVGVLCWMFWLYSNGGVSYLIHILTDSAAYRRGLIKSNYSVLRWSVLACLVSPVLICLTDKGRMRFGTIIIIIAGLVITASKSMSVSEMSLYLINFIIIYHYYKKRLNFLRLLILFLTFLILIMVLKFSYNISGHWSLTSFLRLFNLAFESFSSTVYFTLRNKFMGADVFSVILRYVPTDFQYLGFKVFFQTFWNILPMGYLDIMPQFPTVGNQLARGIMGSEGGGYNPTFFGILYMCFGFNGVIWGSFLFGCFWNTFYKYFLLHKKNRLVMFVYIISLTYVMIYFVRVGGPTITFQRYLYIVIIGFITSSIINFLTFIKKVS